MAAIMALSCLSADGRESGSETSVTTSAMHPATATNSEVRSSIGTTVGRRSCCNGGSGIRSGSPASRAHTALIRTSPSNKRGRGGTGWSGPELAPPRAAGRTAVSFGGCASQRGLSRFGLPSPSGMRGVGASGALSDRGGCSRPPKCAGRAGGAVGGESMSCDSWDDREGAGSSTPVLAASATAAEASTAGACCGVGRRTRRAPGGA